MIDINALKIKLELHVKNGFVTRRVEKTGGL